MTPPVLCIVGASGSGKTTLIERLIPALRRRGLKIGTIKHMNHDFEIDVEGKDSWRHREAGATQTFIASPFKVAMIMSVERDRPLEELVQSFAEVDLVLAEGYKGHRGPKVEVFRPELHEKPLCQDDRELLAVVSEAQRDFGVPQFVLDEVEALADLLIRRFGLAVPALTIHRKAAS
jgi:molybdopterin-guanine dinucleotide biosynthesis protein B